MHLVGLFIQLITIYDLYNIKLINEVSLFLADKIFEGN